MTGNTLSRILVLATLFGLGAHQAAGAEPKLLIKNAVLITMAPEQKKPFVGYLLVDSDGRIMKVGAGEPAASLVAPQTWDAHQEWIIPGFLSAHSHLWQSAFRGLAADKTLAGWIDGLYNQRARYAQAEDFYWFTLQGALGPSRARDYRRIRFCLRRHRQKLVQEERL